jgi:anti-anti-sigma factor
MDRGMAGTTGRDRLSVAVRHSGRSAIFTPEGELDHHTAELLREPMERNVDDGFAKLIVDCSQLHFCDSTGLNVLLSARLKAAAAGGGVHLTGLLPTVSRVFEITGAHAVFNVHDTLDEALTE